MSDGDDDGSDPPDGYGWNERVEVGLVHVGLGFLLAALYAWFLTDERSPFLDWVGLALFAVGWRMWMLDPPPKGERPWRHPLAILLGGLAVAHGWWFQRLPITIAGAVLAVTFPVIVLRRIFRRLP